MKITGPDNATFILFLHGASANRYMWLPQLRALEDEFRVTAINQPGHGDRLNERFSVDAAADETVAWLSEHAPAGAFLVGLSGGGYVAMATADRRPDLVKGLVLSGATAAYRGWGGLSTKLYGFVFPLARRMEKKAAESLKKLAPDELADAMLQEGVSMRGAGQALRDIPGRDYRAMLARYPGPVLLLNGQRDKVNLAEVGTLLAARPDTEVETIADAGHACSISQAAAFNQAVREFVNRSSVTNSA